jgi:acyl-CoA synthetase (AMP-forming)/AMP-acid ligase II
VNIGQTLTTTARRLPDRTAITWGARAVTYAELDRRSNALAHGLASLGACKGDRIAVLMRNRPELIETMYACFKAGFCLVPLNARFTADEVAYHVADSGAVAVVTDAEGLDAARASGASVVNAGPDGPGAAGYEDVLAGAADHDAVVAVRGDDLAWLFYTSGTTGRPKGAMISHTNLDYVMASWLADLTPMTAGDVTLHAAPLTHGAGFHALATTARGARHVIPTEHHFDPDAILDLLAAERVTNTWMVPTQIVLLSDAAARRGGVALADLRSIVYGGSPIAPAELRRAVEIFGPVLVQLFGQGETPMTATFLPAEEHARAVAGDHPDVLSSAGYPRPGMDVRVLGPDDVELANGEVGEVCVRGPAVMQGYWQRPDETAETLRNGWLHTGDLGRMDERGYLVLLDRAKDLIITGGSNVYAVEVESVLAGHPAVREVAVVGVPDRTWGEIVVAAVVADGAGPDLEGELGAHCRAVLAGYKQPRRWEFVASLPRNAYGKVLKRELRQQLAP